MTPPAIAVIIPFYDGHATLGRALASVAGQTLPAAEVVVVDDGSREPPAPQALRLPSREAAARLVRHAENRGIPAARNTGIAACGSPWLAFLDHDDEWEPWHLERQHAAALAAGERAVAYGRCETRTPAAARLWPDAAAAEALAGAGDEPLRTLMLNGMVVPFIGLLARRSLLEEVGGLDESRRGGNDDYDLVLRLAAAGARFVTGDAAGEHSVVHYEGGASYSDVGRFIAQDPAILHDLVRRHPPARRLLRAALARLHYRAGRHYQRTGDRGAARRHLLRAQRLAPLWPRPLLGWIAGRAWDRRKR